MSDIHEIHCFEKRLIQKNKYFQLSLKIMYCNFYNFREMVILWSTFLSKTGFQIAPFFVVI